MKKTYKGGCHCGAVRYEAELDLSEGTLRCNCSICAKLRAWLISVSPDAIRILAGESELTEYQFGSKRIHHLFCKHCGVRSFSWGEGADGGKFYVCHVATLENVGIDELVKAPVVYIDGRNDDFSAPPAETRHM